MFRLQLVRDLSTNVNRVATKEATKPSRDVFGILSATGSKKLDVHRAEKEIPDDADGYDKEEFDLGPRKNAYYYKYEISKYARQGSLGIRKALELFQTMKAKDRLTPTSDSFSPLIYGCAKAGYTEKAFDLFKESTKYVNKPTHSVVTCLLNACAESPFPEYGLEKLDWFLKHIKMHYNYTLNKIQYNSAIKAYGKLGKLDEASKLVQEMISNELFPDVETFNMLLIGCASDKKAGSSIALRIFKRMRLYGIQPNVYTYRLMLRCIRDCGMGSQGLINETLGELPAMTNFEQSLKYKRLDKKRRKDPWAKFAWTPLITDLAQSITTAIEPVTDKETTSDIKSIEEGENKYVEKRDYQFDDADEVKQLIPFANDDKLPNLLSDDHLELLSKIQAIQVEKLNLAHHRLMLFGNMTGFLETMQSEGCQPDTKTYSLILSCIKSEDDCLLEYHRMSDQYSIKRDLLYYDLLIRYTCNNLKNKSRLETGLFFLEEMHKDGIRPNITTFESLALGCHFHSQAKQLLVDVVNCGFRVSNVIIHRLFEVALFRSDFNYLNRLIQYSIHSGYEPTKNLIENLKEKRLAAYRIIVQYEKGRLKAKDVPRWLNEKQIVSFDKFNQVLRQWLGSVQMIEEPHPWSQYYTKSYSKREGFDEFVSMFKALDKAKKEALENAESFGNLSEKAVELKKRATQSNDGSPE